MVKTERNIQINHELPEVLVDCSVRTLFGLLLLETCFLVEPVCTAESRIPSSRSISMPEDVSLWHDSAEFLRVLSRIARIAEDNRKK